MNEIADELAQELAALCADLPETLSVDDMRNNPGLHRLALAVCQFDSKLGRDEIGWIKTFAPQN